MLIEFRVANFRSFNEEQVFSMVASKDEKHPENLIPGEKFNLLKTAAIFGANASGKSNLINAMDCMWQIVGDSAKQLNIGDKISQIIPYKLSKKAENNPSKFEVTMMVKGIHYIYGFTATSDRIHDEWLVAYPPPHKKPRRLFDRSYDISTSKTNWVFRWELKKHTHILKNMTRENCLVLSRGADLNISILKEIYRWNSDNLLAFDLSEKPELLFRLNAKHLGENSEFKDVILKLIKHADIGIDDIRISEQPEIQNNSDRIEFLINTVHHCNDMQNDVIFDIFEDESKGTQRFFAIAPIMYSTIKTGTLLIFDEIDCSLHPLLVRKIIELFQSESNDKGGQLIFTTHDSTLMDPVLFRRDQIYLVEKNKGASELFSLYDFDEKPRNTEAFQRNYLAGRYGAVPSFGPALEGFGLEVESTKK